MVMVVLVGLALALVPIAGGRLGALFELRFQRTWLLLAAVVLQLGLILVPGPVTGWRLGAHLASYATGLTFVWSNRDVPGMWLIGIGAACNGLAIAANAGVMPTTVSALRTAGLEVDPATFANSAALAHPNLLFLGDVFAIPARVPFANVFSVGDVLIAFGAAYAIQAICGSRLVPPRLQWRGPVVAAVESDTQASGRKAPTSPAP